MADKVQQTKTYGYAGRWRYDPQRRLYVDEYNQTMTPLEFVQHIRHAKDVVGGMVNKAARFVGARPEYQAEWEQLANMNEQYVPLNEKEKRALLEQDASEMSNMMLEGMMGGGVASPSVVVPRGSSVALGGARRVKMPKPQTAAPVPEAAPAPAPAPAAQNPVAAAGRATRKKPPAPAAAPAPEPAAAPTAESAAAPAPATNPSSSVDWLTESDRQVLMGNETAPWWESPGFDAQAATNTAPAVTAAAEAAPAVTAAAEVAPAVAAAAEAAPAIETITAQSVASMTPAARMSLGRTIASKWNSLSDQVKKRLKVSGALGALGIAGYVASDSDSKTEFKPRAAAGMPPAQQPSVAAVSPGDQYDPSQDPMYQNLMPSLPTVGVAPTQAAPTSKQGKGTAGKAMSARDAGALAAAQSAASIAQSSQKGAGAAPAPTDTSVVPNTSSGRPDYKYYADMLNAADSNDAYYRDFLNLRNQARAAAREAAASNMRYQFVPIRDDRANRIYFVNADGSDVVLDMSKPEDVREYRRVAEKIGIDINHMSDWMDRSSKPLARYNMPPGTNADTTPDFGFWRKLPSTKADGAVAAAPRTSGEPGGQMPTPSALRSLDIGKSPLQRMRDFPLEQLGQRIGSVADDFSKFDQPYEPSTTSQERKQMLAELAQEQADKDQPLGMSLGKGLPNADYKQKFLPGSQVARDASLGKYSMQALKSGPSTTSEDRKQMLAELEAEKAGQARPAAAPQAPSAPMPVGQSTRMMEMRRGPSVGEMEPPTVSPLRQSQPQAFTPRAQAQMAMRGMPQFGTEQIPEDAYQLGKYEMATPLPGHSAIAGSQASKGNLAERDYWRKANMQAEREALRLPEGIPLQPQPYVQPDEDILRFRPLRPMRNY